MEATGTDGFRRSVVLTTLLSLCFLILGYIHPGAVLLDLPFALAFFLADAAGLWDPSPLWVKEHSLLSWACAFVWPLLVSALYGFAVTSVVARIKYAEVTRSRMFSAILIAMVFLLLIGVQYRAAPISFHYYWTANY